MSTLYLSNTPGTGNQNGAWRVSDTDYQSLYASFIPGEDIYLDRISVSIGSLSNPGDYANNFQVSLYADSIGSNLPGDLILRLDGPTQPTPNSFNDYTPATTQLLASGTKYWIGYEAGSFTGSIRERTPVGITDPANFSLGSGWSAPNNLIDQNGVLTTRAVTYQLYGTPVHQPICFHRGTLILLADGSFRRVEDLRIGMMVHTSAGPKPLHWIGKQKIPGWRIANLDSEEHLPVIIKAGALGDGAPFQDLAVSQCHSICAAGTLVNARYLVNHSSILQASKQQCMDGLDYYHLEFNEEVVVNSNGASTCSYVNQANRQRFDNYHEYIWLYGDSSHRATPLPYKYPRNTLLVDALPCLSRHLH